MSKVTKCPKLQNVQNYKISKVIKYSKLLIVDSFVYVHLTWSITLFTIGSGYKTPKNKISNNKKSNNKTPKITKSPNLQNVLGYKMSKVTKCPKLQNVQNYKMPKVTNCRFFCTMFMFI